MLWETLSTFLDYVTDQGLKIYNSQQILLGPKSQLKKNTILVFTIAKYQA